MVLHAYLHLRRFDLSRKQPSWKYARETGDEKAWDHGKEKEVKAKRRLSSFPLRLLPCALTTFPVWTRGMSNRSQVRSQA